MKLQKFDEFKLNEAIFRDDEALEGWLEEFTEDLEYIQYHVKFFKIKSIDELDDIESAVGPKAKVTIDNKPYTIFSYLDDPSKLMIMDYPISNNEEYDVEDNAFIGDTDEICEMLWDNEENKEN